jgi:hypothetical protein
VRNWSIGALVVAVVAFFYQLFGPSRMVVVSRQSTFITEPLGNDGLPDYVEYYRRISREGVTPENNAAVLLWQAVGPSPVPEELREEFFGGLDMPVPADEGKYLERVGSDSMLDAGTQWLNDLNWTPPGPPIDEGSEFDLSFNDPIDSEPDALPWELTQRRKEWYERPVGFAAERPWRSEQLPPLAAWLEQNSVPLVLAVEASRRPRFYGSFARDPKADGPPLISIKIYTEQEVRYLARGLAVRAMWHLGEDRIAEAYEDITACQRLSRLVSQSHLYLSQIVAQGMETHAIKGLNALASRLHESPELCDQVHRDLERLPMCCDARRGIVHDERIVALDSAIYGMRQIEAGQTGEDDPRYRRVPRGLRRASVDWQSLLTRLNGVFDAVDKAAATGDVGSAEAEKILKPAYAFVDEEIDWKKTAAGFFSRRVRTDLIYHHVGGVLVPFLIPFGNERRTRCYHDLNRVAVALASYRAANGQYPESLEQLVPDFIAEVPADRETGGPLVYERRTDGFLLYGAGSNETDDGGDDWISTSIVDGEWTDEKTDVSSFENDYVVRVPIPPVQTAIPAEGR